MIVRAVLPLVAMLLIAGPVWAADLMEPFYGSFVGTGMATYPGTDRSEQRDLDVMIEPAKRGGFTRQWITVTRDQEGGRTGIGVKRRAVENTFLPYNEREGVYVLEPENGIFTKTKLPNPLRGEPMRWASVEGDMLTVYSMAITDDGGSEMQIYRRQLTPTGLKIDFLRMEDENVEVRVDGELVRAE